MLKTLTNSSTKFVFFKKMKNITEKKILKKNATYALFTNVEKSYNVFKMKEFINLLRKNYNN